MVRQSELEAGVVAAGPHESGELQPSRSTRSWLVLCTAKRASDQPRGRRPLPLKAAAFRSIGLIPAHRSVAWIGAVRPSLLLFTDGGAARPPIARRRAP